MKQQTSWITLAVFISLLFHIGIALWLFYLKAPETAAIKKAPITVTLVDEPEYQSKLKKTFIRDMEIPEEIKKNSQNRDDLAMFLSSRTQRVQKQSRSINIGPNRNSLQPKSILARRFYNQNVDQVKPTAEAQLGVVSIPMPVLPIESTIGTALPTEIEIGSFTALNTDKFTYYSFFERIEDKIRYLWESEVRSALTRISGQEISRYPKNIAVSNLEIILTREGNVEKILLLRSCGLPLLDEAPAKAFWGAKNFMNPPAGLIDPDGKIRLRYQFLVYLR